MRLLNYHIDCSPLLASSDFYGISFNGISFNRLALKILQA